MKTVYHYTNKSGFEALSSGATWYPSTGIPMAPHRDLLDHMQLSIILSQAEFYREQFATRNYVNTRSARFHDVDYGPGWYVTETPPNATTHSLLTELWQGNLDCQDKTEYWLKVITDHQRLKSPDVGRPAVNYLPIYDKLGFDTNRPAGGSSTPVFLVEAGRRYQKHDNQVEVQVLHIYDPPIEVIPPFLAIFDGWSFLDADKQCNILGFLGMDSGFPGVPFPTGIEGLELSRKQLFAIAQIAMRSLGTELVLLDVKEIAYAKSNYVFSFDLIAKLLIEQARMTILAHCCQQRSPVRFEQVESLVNRRNDSRSDLALVFATSTFAQNAIEMLTRARIAPILITAARSQDRRQTHGVAIMDDEMVKYPAHDFWIPVHTVGSARFEKVCEREQVWGFMNRTQ